jgi:hypothetical protein
LGWLAILFSRYELRSFFFSWKFPFPFLLATDGALQMALLPIILSPPFSFFPPYSFLGGFRFL